MKQQVVTENGVSAGSKPIIRVADPYEDLKKKYDLQTNVIIGVLIVGLLTALMMVGGILLEAWHFNTTAYREYSARLDAVSGQEAANKQVLENAREYQETISILLEENKALLGKCEAAMKELPKSAN